MLKNNKSTKPSNPQERQALMLLYIREQGTVSIGQIAAEFSVSEMTVRRMLHLLSDQNLIIRTPGGAMAVRAGSMERTFLERAGKMSFAKDALGRAAAALVEEGETIILDSGTTTQYVARHLAARSNLVVITASLAVLEELAGSPSIEVKLTGGTYRRASHDLCGQAVEASFENIYADRVFFGAAALSFTKGAMNFDQEMPRSILEAGRQKVLVIDSSKIGTEAVYRYCPIEHCDLVITDNGAKAADVERLRKLTQVIVTE
jgi:DeoR/GlpR family transcriptional regulator of sugar metabolism